MSAPKPYYERDGVTLYLGDCLEIMPALPGKCADMVFTDPPYGHNNNDGDLIARWEAALARPHAAQSSPRPILNDGTEANGLFRASLSEMRRLLVRGGCCCCCCCGGGPDPQFARWSLWLDEVFQFKQMVVWDKGPMGMGWHYRRSYETVLVAQVPGAACKWYDDSHKIENIIRWVSKIIPTVSDHPTVKPVALAEWFIRLHTRPGEAVLDPFMGSGTTGVAAIKAGRKFIGIELDEGFCEMARDRIKQAQMQAVLL